MRVSQHLSERLDTSGGTIKSKIPFCKAPCECAICQTYYRSMGEQKVDFCHYDGILTDEEAKSVLISYSNDMNSARDYLSRSIRKYGDLLLDRWKKRTPSKRAALLKLTEPDLPLKKGFAADMEYNITSPEERRSSHGRKHYLLPYIDVETLSKNSATIFGLLHTRAKDSPAKWAPFDHDQIRYPWGGGLVDVSFNEGAIVMFGPQYSAYTK
jgi:hypothetical protein